MEYPDFNNKGTAPCKTNENPLELFFPEPNAKGSGIQAAAAKAICNSGCPYLKECFAWAMENQEPGVWGGTSEHDRNMIRRGKKKDLLARYS